MLTSVTDWPPSQSKKENKGYYKQVQTSVKDGPATVPSALDHYVHRPTTVNFESMTLVFSLLYRTTPCLESLALNHQRGGRKWWSSSGHTAHPTKKVQKYEQYCQQKLMLHVPFRHQSELLGNHTTLTPAYAEFLRSGNIPPSLEDDIHRLQHNSCCS